MVKTEDVPGAGQAVHLVDEDDAGLVLPRHLEQVLHQLLRLSEPLGHQVRAGHGEESGVVGFCGHGLGPSYRLVLQQWRVSGNCCAIFCGGRSYLATTHVKEFGSPWACQCLFHGGDGADSSGPWPDRAKSTVVTH